jgi:hypothetical protein
MRWSSARLVLGALSLVFVLSAARTSFAQNSVPPDLSGTWKLNIAKSTPPKTFNLKKETIVITCSGQKIEIRYARWSSNSYIADGKERPQQGTPASQFGQKAEWHGAVLMTEDIRYRNIVGNPDFKLPPDDQKTYWRLSEDGQTLTREQDDPKGVLIYERVEK